MLGILKMILSGIFAVVVLGMVIGGFAFFAMIGASIGLVLIGVAVIVFIAMAIHEWISSTLRHYKRRRSQRTP